MSKRKKPLQIEKCVVCGKDIYIEKGNWVTIKGIYRHRSCYEEIEQPKEPKGLYGPK